MKRKVVYIDEMSIANLNYLKRKGYSYSSAVRVGIQDLVHKINKSTFTPSGPKPMAWSEQERRHQTGEWEEKVIQ